MGLFTNHLKKKYNKQVQRTTEYMLENGTKRYCSECGERVDKSKLYCVTCGHKLQKIPKNHIQYKKYCNICGERLDKEDNYCGNCGYKLPKKIEKIRICPICGEWHNGENFCQNCGHGKHIDRKQYEDRLKKVSKTKICPNCNCESQEFENYCIICGTKLVKK